MKFSKQKERLLEDNILKRPKEERDKRGSRQKNKTVSKSWDLVAYVTYNENQ